MTSLLSAFRAKGAFERHFDVASSIALRLRGGSGSVTIRPGAQGRAQVKGIVTALNLMRDAEEMVHRVEETPPVALDGSVLMVGDEVEHHPGVSIAYEITLPSGSDVAACTGSGRISVIGLDSGIDLVTGSGSIEAEDASGDVRAETGSGGLRVARLSGTIRLGTGSGSISAGDIAGVVEASTGSGRIECTGVNGALSVRTGSGAIDVSAAKGDVRARTGSGRVRVSGTLDALEADTSSGSIECDGRPQPGATWKLTTGSGGIAVHLAAGDGFSLEARTGSGRIECRQPLNEVISGRRDLRGVHGGGDCRITARTSSGSIIID